MKQSYVRSFGYSGVPARTISWGGNYKGAAPFVCGSNDQISAIGVPLTGAPNCNTKGIIYSDSSGNPNSLLAVSSEVVLSSSTGIAVFPFASDFSALSGSTYWLGQLPSAAGLSILGDAGEAQPSKWNSNLYTNGPSDPYGAIGGTAYQYGFVALKKAAAKSVNYLAGANTSASSRAWNPNYIGVRRIQITTQSIVDSLVIYTYGGARLKGVVYSDNAGNPGTLLGYSDDTYFDSGNGWSQLVLRNPLVLAPGYYWIGFNSAVYQTYGWNEYADQVVKYCACPYLNDPVGTFTVGGTDPFGIAVYASGTVDSGVISPVSFIAT